MSRLEAGFIQPKNDWCDVNELVFSAINDNKGESQNHRIEFYPDENLPLFKLDSGLMEQVLYNIIHNALQYTPNGSIIKIEIKHAGIHCLLTISDNGNGFPANEIKFAFDKFYRFNNTMTGGTGLGLSIVKGFTESMNGVVHVENRSEGGARFVIEIPCEYSKNNDLLNE
jgi:two-component system sensor histidine kinase KdpD